MYIYITYQIKKCVYNKKACVYVYVGGCFDKYISAAIWPPQIKIPGSAPTSYDSNQWPNVPFWHKCGTEDEYILLFDSVTDVVMRNYCR